MDSCKNKGFQHQEVWNNQWHPLPNQCKKKKALILTWVRWFSKMLVCHLLWLPVFQIKSLFLALTICLSIYWSVMWQADLLSLDSIIGPWTLSAVLGIFSSQPPKETVTWSLWGSVAAHQHTLGQSLSRNQKKARWPESNSNLDSSRTLWKRQRAMSLEEVRPWSWSMTQGLWMGLLSSFTRQWWKRKLCDISMGFGAT